MSLDLWLAYAATVAVLALFPGPSVLLVASRALEHGLRKTLATVGGDLSANAVQMAVAGSGVGALIAAAPWILGLLRWAGVAYLATLGVRMARGASEAISSRLETAGSRTARELYLEGFGVSIANPKAILFFAGLFPTFIGDDGPILGQMLILGLTFVALDGAALSLWAGVAQSLRRRAARVVWLGRLGGLLLLAAAGGLAMR